MAQQRSLVERFTSRLKNNPVIALCILVGFVVIWTANFTEAVKKLRSVMPSIGRAVVAGPWQSDVLKDARTRLEFRYVLDLKTDGPRVTGTACRLMPYCEQKKESGICAGYGRQVPILDGTLEKNALTFACDWGEVAGAAPWTWVKLKESFRGSIDGATIRFVQQDDQNNPPVEFVATPVAATKSGAGS
jgi:hypothetical protein